MGFSLNPRGRVIGTASEMLGHPPLHKYRHGGIQQRPWPLPNVWLGVSCEDQKHADERIPLLLQTPAAVRFLSLEPLLERVDLTNFLWTIPRARLNHLHWLIVGGESGHRARPFDIAWARWIVAQGRSAGVPVFVKQLGSLPTMDEAEWHRLADVGPVPLLSVKSMRREVIDGHRVVIAQGNRKGGSPQEWPDDLRVREFPVVER